MKKKQHGTIRVPILEYNIKNGAHLEYDKVFAPKINRRSFYKRVNNKRVRLVRKMYSRIVKIEKEHSVRLQYLRNKVAEYVQKMRLLQLTSLAKSHSYHQSKEA